VTGRACAKRAAGSGAEEQNACHRGGWRDSPIDNARSWNRLWAGYLRTYGQPRINATPVTRLERDRTVARGWPREADAFTVVRDWRDEAALSYCVTFV
jgi:hypothetical protein